MRMIITDGPGHFILITVPGQAHSLAAVGRAAQARWAVVPGLVGAAVHLSVGGEELIEVLICAAAPSRDILLEVYHAAGLGARLLRSRHAQLVPGPGQPERAFSLGIDPSRPRPVLLSILHCVPDRQQALLDYIMASADRFRVAIRGWVGAALFMADDGAAVIEYLQFESLAAMDALQGLPLLDQHRAALLAFGAITGAVMTPIAAWPTMGTQEIA